MKRNRFRASLLTILALTLIASALACGLSSAPSGDQSKTTSDSRSNFTDKTEDQVITVEIKSDMRSNRLHMKAKLEAGNLDWKLIDPEGDIQWQGELTAPDKLNENRKLEVIPGEWRLEISLTNATGNYEVDWKGTN
jgi:hypothetical protein